MKKNRRYYIFILLLGVAAVIALGSSAAFLTLYALLLLPVFALISLLIYPMCVRVRPGCDRRQIFRGDDPTFTLRIRNHSPLSYPDVEITLLGPHVEYRPHDPEDGPRLSLPAGHIVERSYTLHFPYRGVYNVGLKEARAVDFLGLFRMRFKDTLSQRVTVFPRLMPDFTLPLSPRLSSEGDVGFDRFADQTADVTDVRKHDPSDDYRRVHWKLTAKRGEFIVKNFRTPGLPRTVVLLDTARGGQVGTAKLAYDDLMTSLAASALDFCLKNRQAARLIYGEGAGDWMDLIHREDLEPALGLLAVLPLESNAGMLSRSIHSLLLSRLGFSELTVFAGSIDEALCDLLKATFTAGHSVFFHYICPAPSQLDYSWLDSLAAFGIAVEVLK